MFGKKLKLDFMDFLTKGKKVYELGDGGRILTSNCPIDKTTLLWEYGRGIFCPNCKQQYADTHPDTLNSAAKHVVKRAKDYLKNTKLELLRLELLLEVASKNGFH